MNESSQENGKKKNEPNDYRESKKLLFHLLN